MSFTKFVSGVFYRLVDEQGFINHTHNNKGANTQVVELIYSLGNKFTVSDKNSMFPIIQGGNYEKWPENSMARDIRNNEAKYFEEVPEDEVPQKLPNVPYVYTEENVKKAVEQIFEDDAFFTAFKLLSAADAAHILNLKINGFAQ